MSDSYKLSDIYELQMGKTPSRDISDYWADGQYDWISIADLSKCEKYINQTKERITNRAIEESGIKVIPTDTIIMSFKLSIGKVAITQRPVYSNEAIMAFIDKGVTYILPQYAFYLFSAQKWDKGTNRAVMGATLNKATLSQYRVSIHNADEQAEIVNRLNKITDLINFRRKQIQKIDDLVKSQFIEMFGNPISNERKWELCPLEAVGDVGSSKRIFEREYVKEGIPFFRTKEVVELSKGAQISTELFISEERFAELKKEWGCPRKGDLLISAVGTIGVIWIVDDRSFYFKDGNLLQVRSELNSQFLKYVLEWLIADYKQEMSKGTAYAALTINALKKMKIINVPTSAQEWFSHFVEQTDKSKNGYEMEAAA